MPNYVLKVKYCQNVPREMKAFQQTRQVTHTGICIYIFYLLLYNQQILHQQHNSNICESTKMTELAETDQT